MAYRQINTNNGKLLKWPGNYQKTSSSSVYVLVLSDSSLKGDVQIATSINLCIFLLLHLYKIVFVKKLNNTLKKSDRFQLNDKKNFCSFTNFKWQT